MEHRDVLISKILNTAPYQLPPVIHSGGTYVLDVSYRGIRHHHVGITLDESLYRYWHFVQGVNDRQKSKRNPLTELPVPLGGTLPNSTKV